MLDLIRTAGVFMIIAQTMYHFVSGSKYARYVRILIRMMTLAVLIVPLLDLVKSGAKEDFAARLARFEQEYEMLFRDTEYADTEVVEEQIQRAAAEEMKKALAPVLMPYGYGVAGAYTDGERLLITLRALAGEEKSGITVRPVREIHIQVGESEGEKAEESGRQTESGVGREQELAGVIAAYLGTERSWVEVRILE